MPQRVAPFGGCTSRHQDREGLDKLEAEANKAIEMIKEVDALRQEASEKLQKANEQLADVKELAMGYRQTIKNNFPMEQWEMFGISDKR